MLSRLSLVRGKQHNQNGQLHCWCVSRALLHGICEEKQRTTVIHMEETVRQREGIRYCPSTCHVLLLLIFIVSCIMRSKPTAGRIMSCVLFLSELPALNLVFCASWQYYMAHDDLYAFDFSKLDYKSTDDIVMCCGKERSYLQIVAKKTHSLNLPSLVRYLQNATRQTLWKAQITML